MVMPTSSFDLSGHGLLNFGVVGKLLRPWSHAKRPVLLPQHRVMVLELLVFLLEALPLLLELSVIVSEGLDQPLCSLSLLGEVLDLDVIVELYRFWVVLDLGLY